MPGDEEEVDLSGMTRLLEGARASEVERFFQWLTWNGYQVCKEERAVKLNGQPTTACSWEPLDQEALMMEYLNRRK